MARRVVGCGGSARRRWAVLASLVLAVGAGAVLLQAQVLPTMFPFELDRNATTQGSLLGEDWDKVYAGTDTADAAVFVADGRGPTIFTGGASKDDLDTTGWRHKDGSTPDKDELLNGYAARYGDFLFFGADRYAGNGSAQMGIWFFQEDVTAQPDGTFGPGKHKDGDILVLSDFTQGGAVTTIRVFRWNGPGGDIPGSGSINGTLDLLAGTADTPADCVGPPASSTPFCATVNAANAASPWPFSPKNNPANIFPPGHFYEGGIDLAFLQLSHECFASFLIETRSSPSVDAVLKDFVGGGFERCESSVTTRPSDASGNPVTSITLGQSIYDHAVIEGTGSAAFPTGTMTFFICTPTEVATNGGTCSTGGTQVGGAVTVTPTAITNPPTSEALSAAYTPNVAGRWCWRGVYSGDNNYPGAEDASTGECFDVVQLQPAISTAQTWTVKDSATVSVDAGAGNLSGSLLFELFVNSTTCSGSAVLTTTKAIGGALSVTESSDTLTITTPGNSTYSWRVTYTSANQGHLNVTSACHTENGTLNFTNGN